MIKTYLSFTINNEHYALNVEKVLEVLQEEYITPIPNAPEYIKGIINFRGDVVPVFETRVQLNLPKRNENESFNIIVLDVSEAENMFRLGAIVDKVKDVISISDEEIKPVPNMSNEFNTKFLHGIYKLKNDFILLLNVEKLFKNNEIQSITESINN